ncbi:MAG: galactokinase [Pseudohongiella sp.]|nr:MAG: galactokinase [Pseudohongiella sp.]
MSEPSSARFQALLQQATQNHEQHFGQRPNWGACAPGRVNLIGDHTDYNGGFAMPFAIDRHTIALASKTQQEHGDSIRVYSSSSDEAATIALGPPSSSSPQWHDYVRGVLSVMAEDGLSCTGIDISIHSDVPVGSGLSSSAALEMATATLVEAISEQQLNRLEKILLCQDVEHRYANVPCGILDQFCVEMANEGQLLLLDCEKETTTPIPIVGDEVSFVVIDSTVRHQLNDGAYATRRKQCEQAAAFLEKSLRHTCAADIELIENADLRKRARHVVTENARVHALAEAMARKRWTQAGQVMNSSHASLRDDFEVSCPEVDTLVGIAQQTPAVFGARMTGGGFGGCIIALVERAAASAAATQIAEQYTSETGLTALPMLVTPVSGALQITLVHAK